MVGILWFGSGRAEIEREKMVVTKISVVRERCIFSGFFIVEFFLCFFFCWGEKNWIWDSNLRMR